MTTTTTDRLPFTGNDDADRLLVSDPLALLIGFALDQQVPLQKAFSGPLELSRRIGGLDAGTIATMDADDARDGVPDAAGAPPLPEQHGEADPRAGGLPRRALRRRCVADLARGQGRRRPPRAAARPARLRADEGRDRSSRSSASSSASRPAGWEAFVPDHMTLGDVDGPEALRRYQDWKRGMKAEKRAAGEG